MAVVREASSETAGAGGGGGATSTRVVVLTVIAISPGLGSRTMQLEPTNSTKMSDDGRMSSFPRVRVMLPLAASLVACVRQLPPAPPPAPLVPALPQSAPPAAGQTRLIVDVVEGPTNVQRIRMDAQPVNTAKGRPSYRFTEAPGPLCNGTTPCAVDLPVGNVLLGFPVIGKDAYETELIHIGPDPSVYRRSLSVYTPSTGSLFGILATSIGGTSMMTGSVLLPIGLAKDINGMTTAGAITLGAGVVALVIGIVSLRRNAATFRSGASSHYPARP